MGTGYGEGPGCLYDTTACSQCGCCDPSPLETYLAEKENEGE